MAQQLAAFAALEEDPYLVPRTHVRWVPTFSNSSSRYLKLSSGLLDTHTQGIPTDTQIHKSTNKLISLKDREFNSAHC